jgi:hypothetical protein
VEKKFLFMINLNTEKEVSRKIDLIIVADATGSMGQFLQSLTVSIKEILQIFSLTDKLNRVRMLVYYDYCDKKIIDKTEWQTRIEDLTPFIDSLTPTGGGDAPEAAKTAANEILEMIEVDSSTMVIWYADAPPHHKLTNSTNIALEEKALKEKEKLFDWVEICKAIKEKNATVYSIINNNNFVTSSFYAVLSTLTGGKAFMISSTTSKIITKTTINLLLALMGCEHDFSNTALELKFNKEINLQKLINENSNGGYLPPEVECHILAQTPILTPTKSLETNLKTLLQRFDNDTDFEKRVFKLFSDLLTPNTILSLTYNSLFGYLWRSICKRRDDDRRETLLNKLESSLRDLEKSDLEAYKTVRAWLQNSYDQTEEINGMILKAEFKVPAVVLECSHVYTPQEMLELARTCNSKTLSMVCDLMSSLRVVSKEEDLPKNSELVDQKGRTVPLKYIPLSLSNRDLFAIIPHLMGPGTKFSQRPAMMMAAVAFITNNSILKTRAFTFLKGVQGKWFDPEIPENYTLGFVTFMLRLPEFLTENEIELFTFYKNLGGLMVSEKSSLTIQKPFTPIKKVCNDYKIKCDGCGEKRSFTLVTKDENGHIKCGICFNPDNLNVSEIQDELHSLYVECRACCCHYALIRPNLLNCEPKCHSCRKLMKIHYTSCTKCFNKFSDPSNAFEDSFICPECNVDPNLSIDELKVEFKTIYDQNMDIILKQLGLTLPANMNIFGGHSLFKLKDVVKRVNKDETADVTYKYDKKIILNSTDVLKQMIKWIASGKGEADLCMMCFDTKNKNNLFPVCGRKKCSMMACKDCLDTWYGINKAGTLMNFCALNCPFCKIAPLNKILQRHNREALAVLKFQESIDCNFYYCWCIKCYKIKQSMEKECARDMPQFNNWQCEGCIVIKNDNSKMSPCCEVATLKTSGCNHITCPNCEKHWCYDCLKVFETSSACYDHMYIEHGGNGYDENGEEDNN